MPGTNSDGYRSGRQAISDSGHRFDAGIIPFIFAV
jgi:hypothetical protein